MSCRVATWKGPKIEGLLGQLEGPPADGPREYAMDWDRMLQDYLSGRVPPQDRAIIEAALRRMGHLNGSTDDPSVLFLDFNNPSEDGGTDPCWLDTDIGTYPDFR